MATNLLRLDSLRGRLPPAFPDRASHLAAALDRLARRPISRRGLFRVGAVALSAPMLYGPLFRAAHAFTFRPTRDSAVFEVDGVPLWTVDTSRFSGHPSLVSDKGDDTIDLRLKGAYFPGTGIPADFSVHIVRSSSGWSARFFWAAAEVEATVPFETWLLGQNPGVTVARELADVVQVANALAIAATAGSTLEFYPDWTFRFASKAGIAIDGPHLSGAADFLFVRLGDERTPRLLNRDLLRRTELHVSPGRGAWTMTPFVQGIGLRAIDARADELRVDSGELEDGTVATAFAVSNQKGGGRIDAILGEDVLGMNGKCFRLPLSAYRYAVAAASGFESRALLASLEGPTNRMLIGGTAVVLGDVQGKHEIEIIDDASGASRFDLPLREISAPLETGAPARFNLETGARIQVARAGDGGLASDSSGAWCGTLGLHGSRKLCVALQNAKLHVLRPRDFLDLTFRFKDVILEIDRGGPVLRPTGPDPLLIVEFPPQALAEEAFLDGRCIAPELPVTNDELRARFGRDETLSEERLRQLRREFEPDLGRKRDGRTRQPTVPSRSRLAGKSRLVFSLGGDLPKLELASLLDWRRWHLRVDQRARYAPQFTFPDGGVVEIGDEVTALEVPYRLMTSPNEHATWAHAVEPPRNDGPVELWHTRLAVRSETEHQVIADEFPADAKERSKRALRALWVEGFPTDYRWVPHWDELQDPPDPSTGAFRMALDERDRQEIVALTSRFNMKAVAGSRQVPCGQGDTSCETGVYQPSAILVDHLMLSSLGAWMKSKGEWDPPSPPRDSPEHPLSVEKWQHRSTMGRSHYDRVVYKGFLLPFGHRVSLVKLTERKLRWHPETRGVFAFAIQRMFIEIAHPQKAFPAEGQEKPYEGREWPFRSVTLTTTTTPDLALPSGIDGKGTQAFWVQIEKRRADDNAEGCAAEIFDFLFGFEGDGGTSRGALPMIFVSNEVANAQESASDPAVLTLRRVVQEYNCSGDHRRKVNLFDSRVRYAPSEKPGDTEFVTKWIRMGTRFEPDLVRTARLERASQPAFYPRIDEAGISIPALERLSLNAGHAESTVRFDDVFLASGFSRAANRGELFLTFVAAGTGTPVDLTFSGHSDRSAGFVTPDARFIGISRATGLVGGRLAPPPPRKPAVAGAPGDERPPPVGFPDSYVTVRNDRFDPEDFLGGAKIFGSIRLALLLSSLEALGAAPRLIEEVLQQAATLSTIPFEAVKAAISSLRAIKFFQTDAGTVGGGALPTLDSLRAEIARNLDRADEEATKGLTAVDEAQKLDKSDPAAASESRLKALEASAALYRYVHGLVQTLDRIARDPGVLVKDLHNVWGAFASAANDLRDSVRKILLEEIQGRLISDLTVALERLRDDLRTAGSQTLEQLTAQAAQRVRDWSRTVSKRLTSSAVELAELLDDVYGEYLALRRDVDRVLEIVSAGEALYRLGRESIDEIRTIPRCIAQTAARAAREQAKEVERLAVEMDRTYRELPVELRRRFEAQRDVVVESWYRLESAVVKGFKLAEQGPLLKQLEAMRAMLAAQGNLFATVRQIGELVAALPEGTASSYQQTLLAFANSTGAIVQRAGNVILDETAPATPISGCASPLVSGVIEGAVKRIAMMLGKSSSPLVGKLRESLDAINLTAELARIRPGLTFLELGSLARDIAVANERAQVIIVSVIEAIGLYETGRQALLVELVAKVNEVDRAVTERIKPLFSPIESAVRVLEGAAQKFAKWAESRGIPLSLKLDRTLEQLRTATAAVQNATDLGKTEQAIRQFTGALTEAVRGVRQFIERPDLGEVVNGKQILERLLEQLGIPRQIRVRYRWETKLQKASIGGLEFFPHHTKLGGLTVESVVEADTRDGRPSYEIGGNMKPFRLDLQFIAVEFDSLTFFSKNGVAPKVDVKIGDVKLGQGLEFLKELQEKLSPNEGPFLELTAGPFGIRTGFRFGLDTTQIAAFTIQNVRFIAAYNLPFDGTPSSLDFQISERARPFLISAGIYGGGGFFGLRFVADRIVSVEASFEYGAVTAFAVGVVRGSGRITVGVYFKRTATNDGGGVLLEGFFYAGGEASLAGIARITADFLLSLRLENSVAQGRARFKVSVKIGWFRVSYGIGMEKKLTSGGQGPSGSAQSPSQVLPLGPTPPCGTTQEEIVLPDGTRLVLRRMNGEPETLGQPKAWKRYREEVFAW